MQYMEDIKNRKISMGSENYRRLLSAELTTGVATG